MKKISRKQYLAATSRLEVLINLVDANTPIDDPLAKEFLKISDIIEEYESIHYPMEDMK
jgi:HTH-type transcriptional regulator/antitoxin HigA